MASEVVSAPVSTTVIAMDLPASSTLSASALTGFDRVIGDIARQLGFVSTEEGGANLALTLAPGAVVAPVLMRLSTAMVDFETINDGLHVRAVAHHGVVFRTETGGNVTYVGSAIRAARSALRRVPATGGMVATREFVDFAAESHIQSKNFELLPPDAAMENLSPVHVIEHRKSREGLSGSDPALLDFLKKRLAEDVGPFAAPLVDNVSHSAMNAKEVVAALSHEINDAATRQRFELDAWAYIKKRLSPPPAAKAPVKEAPKPAAKPEEDRGPETRSIFSRFLNR